ncbi:hypothetical protein AAIR98_001003 [Elusimicrobium simillimum]|uniref:hypothetical protein n=1 Tax=Elusimicrobium simillimum TaxID=3143438 RepID=UPI003C702C30
MKKLFLFTVLLLAAQGAYAQNSAQPANAKNKNTIPKEYIDAVVTMTGNKAEAEDFSNSVIPALPDSALTEEQKAQKAQEMEFPTTLPELPSASVSARPVVNQPPQIEPVKSARPVVTATQSVQPKTEVPGGTTFSLIKSSGTAQPKVDTAQIILPSDEALEPKTPDLPASPVPVKVAQEAPKPAGRDYSNPGKGWSRSYTNNFNIFIDNTRQGIYTAGLNLVLENAHATMIMNMPNINPSKTNVYVYKSKEDYLNGEFKPFQWSEAVFILGKSTIVLYNNNGDTAALKRVFMHEYTHMLNDDYFNPGGKGMISPLWLDEGMAVNMEDIADTYSGGAWANDLLIYDIRAQKQKGIGAQPANVIYFERFVDFMKDSSIDKFTKENRVQDWYLQAYAMLRFLWKPYNAQIPENKMQFQRFLQLLKEGEPKLNPRTLMPIKDSRGRTVYQKLTVDQALQRAYGFANIDDFESRFWVWYRSLKMKQISAPKSTPVKRMGQTRFIQHGTGR